MTSSSPDYQSSVLLQHHVLCFTCGDDGKILTHINDISYVIPASKNYMVQLSLRLDIHIF
jgi:hypothetical protein